MDFASDNVNTGSNSANCQSVTQALHEQQEQHNHGGETELTTRTNLSSSALSAAEAFKEGGNINQNQDKMEDEALRGSQEVQNECSSNSENQKHNNYHRWPSVALDTTRPPDLASNSFLFADQISSTGDNDTHDTEDANSYASYRGGANPESNDNNNGHRRMPINILKLPWQHPFRQHESNRNPYKIPRALFATLFLTTALALLSAWDAQLHCVSNETDALLALLGEEYENYGSGDEYQQQADSGDYVYTTTDEDAQAELSDLAVLEVKATCRKMFHYVMIPVGLVTGAGSLLALGILRQHQQSFGSHHHQQRNPEDSKRPLMAQSPPCFYFFYLPLLFVSGLIVAAWTVGIILVMLRPRSNDTDNPYSSLAAVDAMGRVADNANLYYMAWISEMLAILIFYQLGGAFVRQHWLPRMTSPPTAMGSTSINLNPSMVSTASSVYAFPWQKHAAQRPPMLTSAKSSMDNSLIQQPFSAKPSLSPNSLQNQHQATTQRYHSSRIKWFQTFYQLRVRTGLWVAALLSSLVVVATSAHIFHEILMPAAQSLFDDDDYLYYENHSNWWNIIEDNKSYGKVCVVLASQDTNLSEELCRRTFFSLLSGFVAIILCSTAIVLHFLTRRSAAVDALYLEACGGSVVYHELALQMMATNHRHHLPLRTELLLSVVLSFWLGWNALWVSATQGPASRVSNLYYSSWACFILCLRICLGCVEEYFDIQNNDDDHHHPNTFSRGKRQKNDEATTEGKERASYKAPDLFSVNEDELHKDDKSEVSIVTTQTTPQLSTATTDSTPGLEDKAVRETLERERTKRLRRYFFLGAFSTVSAGSAFDAAKNQAYVLTRTEKYMVTAPAAVALLSAVLFLLCLSKVSYGIVCRTWCGGILSLLSFWAWLANLILTMHSDDSWAVNGVGEIEMANIYYFSWASIITAGLQLASYMKDAFGIKKEPYMIVVWAAMGKICFVILGAAFHIWHTISDQCDIIEIQNSAITFCSRTILALIVPSTGLVICGLVLFVRLFVPTRWFSNRSRAHCEAVLSIFLMLLFGVAAGMITGIGGPGQSVGDLYYSIWFAFWVSIGIFVSCYDQIKVEEMESDHSAQKNESLDTADSGVMV